MRTRWLGLGWILLALTAGWTGNVPGEEAPLSIIPWPATVTAGTGVFTLDAQTKIAAAPGAEWHAQYLAERLGKATGLSPKVTGLEAPQAVKTVRLILENPVRPQEEGYALDVKETEVVIRAGSSAGLLYGCQTLLQLLPPKIFSPGKVDGVDWKMPCVHVEDQPRFPWRGLMLDPARFFLTKEYLERYIDLLALHKMNRLHLHLTDSEAWTVQIEAYPQLTNLDTWPGKLPERAAGFYSHADIREIVQYAQERNVTVIPEIEFPAHSAIAMAAYPELMCPNNPLRTGARAWDAKSYEWAEYCASSAKTYEFIAKVLDEVMSLFPSQYIHVGGDEYFGNGWKGCPQCQQEVQAARAAGEDNDELKALFTKCLGDKEKYLLYRRMMRKICAYVVSKGRTPVLWDDLSWQGQYPAGTLINQWHYKGGMDYFQFVTTERDPAVEAAATGHDVVASPFSHLYFDLGDPRNTQLVYGYEPVPEGLAPELARHILGPSAPAWAQPQARADEMIFPRLLALAEVGWAAKGTRNWEAFVARNLAHYRRLNALGVKFYTDWSVTGAGARVGGWKPADLTADSVTLEWDVSAAVKAAGPHEVLLMYEQGAHGVAMDWVALFEDGREIARDAHHGFSGYMKENIVYTLPVAEWKPGAKYTIKAGFDCHLGRESTGNVYMRKVDTGL